MSIILFIIVLGVLILSHELGHFIFAKRNGIRVDEFAIGFPPRLFKFKKGETLYSINLMPFGGYVKIHGEEGDSKDDPRSFASKSFMARAMVIVAGVAFNLILAWVLISFGYIIGLPSSVSSAPSSAEIIDRNIVVLQVQENTPAKIAGLEAGDYLIGFESVQEVQNYTGFLLLKNDMIVFWVRTNQ